MKLQFFRRTCLFPLFIIGLALTGCQNIQDSPGKNAVGTPIQGHLPVQTRLWQYLFTNHISGSVVVAKNNKIIFNEGIGYANFGTRTLNKPTTTYPLASITKSIVATSIMQLQEKGRLSIQDPVSKYLPHFPNGKNIKLINLLDHTSGIRPPLSHQGIRTPLDLIKRMEGQPEKFQPGTQWDYRDENYAILGYILEKVSGQPLHTYIRENIFAKAGMKDVGFINQNQPVPITAVGYIKKYKLLIPTRVSSKAFLFGFGDIYSTAYDLCLYDEALIKGKLVSKKSLQEMLKPHSQSKYGIGFYNVGFAIQSRGVLDGYESFHAIYNDKIYISILLNVRDKRKDVHLMSQEIHNIVASQT